MYRFVFVDTGKIHSFKKYLLSTYHVVNRQFTKMVCIPIFGILIRFIFM